MRGRTEWLGVAAVEVALALGVFPFQFGITAQAARAAELSCWATQKPPVG